MTSHEAGGCAPPVQSADLPLVEFLRDMARNSSNIDRRVAHRLNEAADALARQALRDEAGEAVGEVEQTHPMMGSGFMHVFFHATRLPDGTKIYTRPAPAAEAAPQGGVEWGDGGALMRVYDGLMATWEANGRGRDEGSHAADLYDWAQTIYYAARRRRRDAATPPSAPAVETVSMHLKALDDMAAGANVQLLPDGARQLAALIRRLSAPVPQEGVDWQKRCLEHGFKYWRAPDAHGVECTHEQALDLLRDLLGVEVDFVEPAALAAGALPQGMVLVPRELTEEMFAAHLSSMSVMKKLPPAEKWRALAQSAWNAMLAAAPAQGVR